MADEEENEEALLLILILLRRRRRRKAERQPEKRRRCCWVREIFTIKRKQQGDYHNLVLEMRQADREFYFR